MNSNKLPKALEELFQILDERHNHNTRLKGKIAIFFFPPVKKIAQTQQSEVLLAS